mgnify:CR=1 FL=1
MKISYDPRCNIAYVTFRDEPIQVKTIQVSEEINVDVAPDGSIYGIELLNANIQLGALAGGKLILENEATGSKIEIALPR